MGHRSSTSCLSLSSNLHFIFIFLIYIVFLLDCSSSSVVVFDPLATTACESICDFFNSSIWQGGIAPTAGDFVVINSTNPEGKSYLLSFNTSIELQTLEITPPFNSTTNSTRVDGGCAFLISISAELTTSNVIINGGSLMLVDGILTTNSLVIGSFGVIEVSGSLTVNGSATLSSLSPGAPKDLCSLSGGHLIISDTSSNIGSLQLLNTSRLTIVSYNSSTSSSSSSSNSGSTLQDETLILNNFTSSHGSEVYLVGESRLNVLGSTLMMGHLYIGHASIFHSFSTLDFQTSLPNSHEVCSNEGSFSNSAFVNISGLLICDGVLSVNDGSIVMVQPPFGSVELTTSGINVAHDGLLSLFYSTSHTTSMASLNPAVRSPNNFTHTLSMGGTVCGGGLIEGTLNLTQGGSIGDCPTKGGVQFPLPGSVIFVEGNLMMDSTSSFFIPLDPKYLTYASLAFSGSAQIDGELMINTTGLIMAGNSNITLVSFLSSQGGLTGTFANVTAPSMYVNLTYGASEVTALVYSSIPIVNPGGKRWVFIVLEIILPSLFGLLLVTELVRRIIRRKNESEIERNHRERALRISASTDEEGVGLLINVRK